VFLVKFCVGQGPCRIRADTLRFRSSNRGVAEESFFANGKGSRTESEQNPYYPRAWRGGVELQGAEGTLCAKITCGRAVAFWKSLAQEAPWGGDPLFSSSSPPR
jgi:hypothetical protein